jgi:MarR family transcriptional regulator, 2-MHQ and catechol-resistance regulon repressor
MATHHQGSPEERRALDTYIKLARASATLEARVNRHLSDAGLTTSQFGVLEALYHLGPLHQQQLAAKILKSGGNLTLVLDNLGKRGLVCRERSADDRRFVRVHLTEAGQRLVRDIFPRHVAGVVAAVSCLSATEQEQLAALLKKLGTAPDLQRPEQNRRNP